MTRGAVDLDFRIVAIIAAYNEEEIVGQVVGDLIEQGIEVYFLDHQSTDDTVAEVMPYLGRGLLAIERLPEEDFAWESILRRKEALARELDARWVVHHDADEFRESPWARVSLREGIERVDALGYNAIDFELLNFRPTHDRFRRGDDVRGAFPFYEPGGAWDKLQVKCWRNPGRPVDLVSSGGHDVAFEGRQVFPLRFILRHYPIRSQAHGERKVLVERPARFAAERARGWHCQYEGIRDGHQFVRDPKDLRLYEPDAVRVQVALRHRGVEELEHRVAAQQDAIGESGRVAETLRRELDDRSRELAAAHGQLALGRREAGGLKEEAEALRERAAGLGDEVARLGRLLSARQEEAEALHERAAGLGDEVARLRRLLSARDEEAVTLAARLAAVETRLEAVYASRSWRWTAPLRIAQRALTGSGQTGG